MSNQILLLVNGNLMIHKAGEHFFHSWDIYLKKKKKKNISKLIELKLGVQMKNDT